MGAAYNVAFGSPSIILPTSNQENGGISPTALNLPNQNDGVANISFMTMADTITDIGYCQGTTTGTPAAGSYTISLQTLNAGNPSGTMIGGVTPTTFTPLAANDNTWVWVSLGANTYTLTQGQECAIVLQRTAATDAANKITANYTILARSQGPMVSSAAAGVWTKARGFGLLAMKGAGVYGNPFTGTSLFNTNNIGSTTESGMTFNIPANFCSTYKLKGFRLFLFTPTNNTNTFVATTYSGITSPTAIDQLQVVNNRFVSGAATGFFEGYFTTSSVYNAGTTYVLAFGTTTATDARVQSLNVVAAGDFDGWQFQQQTAFTTRTASSFAAILSKTATGNFTTTATKRIYCDLIFEDFTAPAGGSGGVVMSRVMTGM